MADYSAEIARINELLARGLSKVTDQDGRTHEYDLEELAKQRDYLLKQQAGGFPSQIRRQVYNPAFRNASYRGY